jgi:hypothetical protein
VKACATISADHEDIGNLSNIIAKYESKHAGIMLRKKGVLELSVHNTQSEYAIHRNSAIAI